MSDVAYAQDPRLDLIAQPVTSLNPPPPGGFVQNVWDEVMTSWWVGEINKLQDFNVPAAEGYDPLYDERIKGKEPYVDYLREARSPEHFDAIWNRLTTYEQKRMRLTEEGGLASALTAGVIDPANLVPFGVGRGVGVLRGALLGGASTAAVTLGTQIIQDQSVPVSREEMAWGTAMGFGFGSLFGGVIGRNIPDNAQLSELSRTVQTQAKVLDDAITSGLMPNPYAAAPATPFEVRPTTPNAVGVASAFGLEKVVSKLGNFGALISAPFRGFEDLGHALAGEGDLLTKRNKLALEEGGGSTQESAHLRSLYWQGRASVLLQDIESIYARYIGGGDTQFKLGGVNVPVTFQRMKQAITGRGPDGKMSLNEFHAAVSRAHKRDRIETDDPFVREAVEKTRAYYEEFKKAGLESGMIVAKENVERIATRLANWTGSKKVRLAELEAKDTLTANEKAEVKLLNDAIRYGEQRGRLYSTALRSKSVPKPPAPPVSPRPTRETVRAINDDFSSASPTSDKFININELQDDDPQWLYHGTNVRLNGRFTEFVDQNGNLRLKASYQSLDKRVSVSFTPFVETAKDYATREKGGGPNARNVSGAGIFVIDREYLPNLEQRSGEALSSPTDIVIPPDGWKFATLQSNDVKFLEELKADIASFINELNGKSNKELLDLIRDQNIDVEVKEANYGSEQDISGVGKNSEYAQWYLENFDREGLDIKVYAASQLLIQRGITDAEIKAYTKELNDSWASDYAVESRNSLEKFIERFDAVKPYDAVSDLEALRQQQSAGVVNTRSMLNPTDAPRMRGPANANDEPYIGPENEANYLNRIWALDKVLADEAGPQKLRAVLMEWYRDNPLPDNLDRIDALMNDLIAYKTSKNPNSVDLLAKLERLSEEAPGLTQKQYDLMVKLRTELTQTKTFSPKQWEFFDKLTEQWRKERGKVDFRNTDDAIEARVDRTIAHILKTAELGEYQVGRALETPALARDLNIPNELVWDFIEDDISVLIRSYAQRMGPAVEYGRMFGSRDAEMAIHDAALQAAKEAKGPTDRAILDQVETHMNQARAVRDDVLRDSYAANPLSLNRKIVQGMSAYTMITTLSSALVTSLSEMAKPLMMWGFGRSFSFAMKAMNDREAFEGIKRDVQVLTAGGLEAALHMHAQRFAEQGGVLGGSQNFAGRLFDSANRKLINFANGPYFVLNLLGPFTDILKNYTGVMSAHFLIDDARAIAAGKADKRTLANWRGLSLTEDDAARLAAMPIEDHKGLNLTNIAAWPDQDLVRKFGAAVASEQRRAVVTAGPANVPDIARGFVGLGDKRREFAYLRLPFLLMNFAFASVNKTLLSALQGRDANAIMGAVTMIGAAYMVQKLKTSDAAWDRMDESEKLLRAIENSGLLAVMGDINSKLESLTRSQMGVRPALGMEPRMGELSTDAFEPYSALGPLGTRGADLYQLFFDNSLATRDQSRILRRALVPELFYLKPLFDQAERGALEAID